MEEEKRKEFLNKLKNLMKEYKVQIWINYDHPGDFIGFHDNNNIPFYTSDGDILTHNDL